ncbi:MAG: hypothetical protein Q9217_006371 [Psora testacea]
MNPLHKAIRAVPWRLNYQQLNVRWFTTAMQKSILLTEQEVTLRQLLLDTADYVSNVEGCTKPTLRFTGGWVRDKLLGSTSHDIDIGIDNMTGLRFGTLMKQYLTQPDACSKYQQSVLGNLAKIEANPQKSKHLETVTTKILGFAIDLVNLRKETYSEDSRNPTMDFGSPEEDALRRDATVNALFYNLSTSEIEDFTRRGLRDMALKVIKTPLPPSQTFEDDPLRVLRHIRFASRLGYQIDPEDKTAMSDSKIKHALKAKISRERVGVEINKMLRGPDPHMALSLIDSLNLYNTIFTDVNSSDRQILQTGHWSSAYDKLHKITTTETTQEIACSPLQTIKSILLRDPDDLFLAWMMACFVPWARVSPKPPSKSTTRRLPAPASVAAREGLKVDNRICKVVDDAITGLADVIEVKDCTTKNEQAATSPLKRKLIRRDIQGQAIRGWGSRWRSTVMFALLAEISEATTEEARQTLVGQYADWLAVLRSLDLLDVDSLKPIVNGNQISKALGGGKQGPWMKKAMDIAMEWQLRNPEETNPAGGIEEVVSRKKELCLN